MGVPPAGFEPAHPPPEGGALSPELRGRDAKLYLTTQPVRTGQGRGAPTSDRRSWSTVAQPAAGSGCAPRSASICVITEISDSCDWAIFDAKLRTTGLIACSA